MRHFIAYERNAGPVTALTLGMLEAPAQTGLITLRGPAQTSSARANGTPFRAVSVTPITVRADHHAFAAGHTKILSSSNVHGSIPWRARQDAALRDTLRMQRPCHHCQVTGRGIGKRPNFMAMSRLLLSTGSAIVHDHRPAAHTHPLKTGTAPTALIAPHAVSSV